MPYRVAIALLALQAVLSGCGPRGLSTGPTVPTFVQVGGGRRVVTTVTDLDQVRDAAGGGERVYVATDRGVLVHPRNGAELPTRLTRADGLPSDDVTAVAVGPDGAVLAATPEGIALISGGAVVGAMLAPPVGRVSDLYVSAEAVAWACGEEGLAQKRAEGWVRFGEPTACTLLVPTPEGALWVGTTQGLWLVEGDVIREHGITRGIPEGYVRDIVPVRPGQAMALLQGPTDSQIGFFDGERWYGYTVDDFEAPVVGLTGHGGRVLLLTPGHAFAIAPDDLADGVPLTALSRSERFGVHSYRARITAPEDIVATDAERQRAARGVRREPSRLVEVPVGQPTVEAPPFSIAVADLAAPEDLVLVRRDAGVTFLADRNRGVTAVSDDGNPVALRSLDLIDDQDLQIAVDTINNTWILGRDGDVARLTDAGIVRVQPPDGAIPQAIATGPQGVYVAAMVDIFAAAAATPEPRPVEDAVAPAEQTPSPTPATVRIYRVNIDGWTAVTERTLTVPTRLHSIPFLGIDSEEQFWVGVRVDHESGEGSRMRGVAVFGAQGDAITYHYRGATRENDGEGALSMPDEVTAVDLNQRGFAWFPSLSGAVRVGNFQAVVFGEARGVRGEVVSDVAVGENDRVWVAAAEGVGYYEGSSFEFRLPRAVQQARPIALCLDNQSSLWAAGVNGAFFYDGNVWQQLTEDSGLPTDELIDVEADAADRVWFLARDRLLIFDRPAS